MNFFTALIETCKGTKVFLKLLSQTLGKSLWHLFFLILICSLFIMLCTYSESTERINETFAHLEETFGDIQVGKKGIISTKIKKTISFPVVDDRYTITYIPEIDKAKLPKIDADDMTSGFLWTPTMLTSWTKLGPDKFLLIPFAYCSDKQLSIKSMKRSSILTYIKNNTSAEKKVISLSPELNWTALRKYCTNTLISVAFLGNIVGILLQTLLFVMMFSFILNLSSKNTGAPALKYKTRFVIGIYVSFPPLLIATMFSAFQLPFLSFNSVYVICFSIYLIVVFTHLQLNLNASGQDQIEQ
ncbi:MAG: DUF1189 domain-containing protein [Victivallales bacterium]|nr:DUF1189 domain-containing protein [Victivallales bacterium]